MTEQLRAGLVAREPAAELKGEMEPDASASSGIDEVYIVAGHKGQPKEVAKRGGSDAAAGWRADKLAGAPGRGTLANDKQSILGLIQRGGEVVLRMLANVQQATIKPVITAAVTLGTLVHTDEYSIYARLGLQAQNGLSRARPIRPRRGRGRLLRGPRQHHGRFLVAAATLAAPAPGYLAGQASALSRLPPVRAQRTPMRQSSARLPCCNLSSMTPA